MKAVIDPEEPEFGRTIVKDRGWEGHIMGVVRTHLAPGHVFVDVGANVGVMSFHAASIVGPQGRVVAFEPHVGNATAFRRGIVANGLDNVRLFAFGLSDEHRMISLSDGSNAKVTGEASALQGAEVIQAIPGDEITLPLRRVDLIKIDVEGFELRVLRGLRRTIRKFRPKILCEFNPLCLRAHGGIDPAELADHLFALAPHGDLVEHDGSLTRVRSAKELMDLWCQRDVEVTREGVLPAGWLHFDILLDSARSRLWRRSP